jgi:hypothetical protein
VSDLRLAGGRGLVVLDHGAAQAQGEGPAPWRLRPGERHHVVEAVVTRARGEAGTWRFECAAGAPGRLHVRAGHALSASPTAVVFRLAGRAGERVAFALEAGP